MLALKSVFMKSDL